MPRRELRAEKVFALACMHAFADGFVDANENGVLKRLAAALDLDVSRALQIAAIARRACRRETRGGPPLDAARVFAEAVVLARADGTIDESESALLDAAACALGLGSEHARRLARAERLLVPGGPARDSGASDHGGVATRGLAGRITARACVGRWLRFLRHPLFTASRLFDGASPYRRALTIGWRIWWLMIDAPFGPLLKRVRERVDATVVAVWELERQLDELSSYLAGRGLGRPSPRSSARVRTPVDEMHERQAQLAQALASLLGELTRIEDRVAAYVLASSAPGLASIESDLHEAIEELDIIVKVVS